MIICNSCRYCEGFCAVFPAMELRRIFSNQDLIYLANLCHDCRGCYYACQYAPPHEFSVNVSKTLAELRVETYKDFTWPSCFAGLFQRNGLSITVVTVLSIVLALLLVFVFRGPSIIFSTQLGEGAFYSVIPYGFIVAVISVIGFYILAALIIGIVSFWRGTGGKWNQLIDPRANVRAMWDTLQLRYLGGGGYGCNYPGERFSYIKRRLHHFIFYGFMSCFLSTTVGAFYHHLLHWDAPYPFWSWPVTLGTVGGVSLLIGTVGLLCLKWRMDAVPSAPSSFGMDVGFLFLLFLTSLTGLLLLAFRETPAMGTLLTVHLGIVVGLFITLPYGKFVHAIYRYAALVRNSIEQSHGGG